MKSKFLALFVGLLASVGAFAADATLTWTQPTTRTDGSTLPAAEIIGYSAVYGLCTASDTLPPAVQTVTFPGAVSSGVVTGLATGKWCFALATIATGDLPGEQVLSAYTGTAIRRWVAPPNPPTLLLVANRTVYDLRYEANMVATLRVKIGEIPVGTECGSTVITTGTRGNYYAVDLSAVALDPTKVVKSDIVVAYCEAAS